ncbi:unnamed protein product [Parnassius mnemosyne]|uniref:Uncharacterized protein n=1 Tax=Parnassius mnemosyne TaxID=213953 RepID=A0AAV1L8G9_9NEOP
MPMSAAERQRQYREKLKISNSEKFKEQKKRNCERTLRQYRAKTANYSEEQKEQLRQKWRENRNKEKESMPSTSQMVTQSSKENTKNFTDLKTIHNLQRRIEYKFKKENIQLRRKIKTIVNRFLNLQKKVPKQHKNIDSMKKMHETLIMKLEDNRTADAKNSKDTKNNVDNIKISEPDEVYVPNLISQTAALTPIKRVSEYINTVIPNIETPKKEKIKKKLIEHDLLKESFKCEYKNSSNTEKNILKRIVNSDVVKKI